jgi:hypothetical protein
MNNCRRDGFLDAWPVTRPEPWFDLVNDEERDAELACVRDAIARSAPLGSDVWVRATAADLGILHSVRSSRRPKAVRIDSRPLFE